MITAPFKILDPSDSLVPHVAKLALERKEVIAVSFGSTVNPEIPTNSVLLIYGAPLKFELYHSGVLQIVVNERSLMHYEKSQNMSEKGTTAVGLTDAERHGGKEVVDYGEDGESVLDDQCHHLTTVSNTIFLFKL